jgi:hypothetical protein
MADYTRVLQLVVLQMRHGGEPRPTVRQPLREDPLHRGMLMVTRNLLVAARQRTALAVMSVRGSMPLPPSVCKPCAVELDAYKRGLQCESYCLDVACVSRAFAQRQERALRLQHLRMEASMAAWKVVFDTCKTLATLGPRDTAYSCFAFVGVDGLLCQFERQDRAWELRIEDALAEDYVPSDSEDERDRRGEKRLLRQQMRREAKRLRDGWY